MKHKTIFISVSLKEEAEVSQAQWAALKDDIFLVLHRSGAAIIHRPQLGRVDCNDRAVVDGVGLPDGLPAYTYRAEVEGAARVASIKRELARVIGRYDGIAVECASLSTDKIQRVVAATGG